jgi:hypothetical protein
MKLFSYLRQAAVAALVGFGLFGMVAGPAAALTIPPNFAPREFNEQMVHYVRITIPFNGCTMVSLTCSYKVGAIPYNSFVTQGWFQVLSTFTGAIRRNADYQRSVYPNCRRGGRCDHCHRKPRRGCNGQRNHGNRRQWRFRSLCDAHGNSGGSDRR